MALKAQASWQAPQPEQVSPRSAGTVTVKRRSPVHPGCR